MDKNSSKKLRNPRCVELQTDGGSGSDSSGQSASPKRKRKRRGIWETAEPHSNDSVGVMTRSKRKAMDGGEGQSQQREKVQKLDPLSQEESATSSVNNETSTNPLKGSSAFVGAASQSGIKRKSDIETERPSKKLRNLDLRETKSAEVQTDASTDPLEGGSAFVADVRESGVKRKSDDETEHANKKIRKSLDLHEQRSAGVQTDSSADSFESCSALEPDLPKLRVKRKIVVEAEQPRKKSRKSPKPCPKKRREIQKDLFEAKYRQDIHLGEGGCGCVYAGYRIADEFPVAIKRIPRDKVFCKEKDGSGKRLSVEVAVMLKLSENTISRSATVNLLDWYDLGRELVLVLERPVPCEDLFMYIVNNDGCLPEDEAKLILTQLLQGLTDLHRNHIFHRDIKIENILIETGSDVPCARLIDFGLSCFFKTRSVYRTFYGTPDHVPPEYFSCNAYRPGPTTVWQLGVVLYEMLHPNSRFETTKFLRQQQPFDVSLSNDCQDFLTMCLTKTPRQRPTLEDLHLHPWLRHTNTDTCTPATCTCTPAACPPAACPHFSV